MPKTLKELEDEWEKKEKTRRVSFMVQAKAREGELKPKRKRISFISRR